MSTESNKALVRRYLEEALEAVKGGNMSATDEFLTEGAAFYDPGRPPSVGWEAQKQRSAAVLSAFPDVRFVIEDMVAEGDKVAVQCCNSWARFPHLVNRHCNTPRNYAG